MQQIVMVRPHDIHTLEGRSVLVLDGRPIRLLHLCDALGEERPAERASERALALLLGSGERQAACVVDAVLGEQELMLQWLPAPLQQVRLIAGATILADGRAAPALCGLLNLRGRYLPVLDGRVLVGESPHYELSNQIIIVGHARPKLGVLVDRVNGVASFSRAAGTPIQNGIEASLLDRVINSEHGALIMLDLSVLATFAAAGQQAAVDQSVAVLIEPS